MPGGMEPKFTPITTVTVRQVPVGQLPFRKEQTVLVNVLICLELSFIKDHILQASMADPSVQH